jgi:hypothetical protein
MDNDIMILAPFLTPLRVEVDAKPQTPIFAALDKSTYCF